MAAVPPSEPANFQEGFTLKTAIGALFVALIMLPGGIYLGLAAGWGVGDAAEWVTIVLFAEVARRSFQPLRKQEIYVLFYIAASLTTVINQARGLGGGPFGNLIWNAFFVSSDAAKPFAGQIPAWAVPSPNSPAITERALWHVDWKAPIILLVLTDLVSRLSWMSMGYALFRVTRDIEQLPFPMAPIAAAGATALADAGTQSWRWKVFSVGSLIGIAFGAIYIALPVLTGALFGKPIELLPIPFADFTLSVESFLPAAIVGLSLSLGNLMIGFVLPFELLLGSCIASVVAMLLVNPILYHSGLLPSFRHGSSALVAKLSADIDFWLSIGIGINIAVGILGIALVIQSFRKAFRERKEAKFTLSPPPGRGDVPIWWAIGVWAASTGVLVIACRLLVPSFPVWILLVFGFLWSPLNSYVSARMHGMAGRGVSLPYLREATVVASGYNRPDIWYAPMPLMDHGWAAQRFREVELTETKFTSILKAELFLFPLLLAASFGFWAFFWHSTALPSSQFPYAQKFWPNEAALQAVMQQLNVAPGERQNWVLSAIKPTHIAGGAIGGLAVAGICALFKAPLLFFYGLAGGVGLMPAFTVPQLLGGWLGKRYFARRYGQETWGQYAPIVLAGFSCGVGLIAMGAIAVALIVTAISSAPY